jgi:hypothetical protein
LEVRRPPSPSGAALTFLFTDVGENINPAA